MLEMLQMYLKQNVFISQLPEMVNLFNNKIYIADYFVSRLSKDLIRILVVNTSSNVHSVCGITQVVWNFFSQARGLAIKDSDEIGHVFLRSLYDFLVTSSFFAGRSFSVQATALGGKPPEKAPVPPLSQNTIEEMAKKLITFIESGHLNTKFIVAVQRFDGSDYSCSYFKHLFRLLGVHGALFFDDKITQLIADNLVILSQKVTSTIASSKEISMKIGSIKDSSVAIDALLRISVALAMRSIILSAIETVINEALPGFTQYSTVNEMNPSPETDLIHEVLNFKENYSFIAHRIQGKIAPQEASKFADFFKCLGFMFSTIDWKSSQFFPEENTMTNNHHLLPYGLNLLFSLSQSLFNGVQQNDIQNVIFGFLTTLNTVYNSLKDDREKDKLLAPELKNTFLILVDKFPQVISRIDYGTMKDVFPYALLSASYHATE